MKRALILYSLLIALLLPYGVSAQDRQQWRRLSPEDKAAIERWRSLPRERQEYLRKEWDHWRSLPQDRRETLKQRFEEFRELPPDERQRWRDKFERREFSPDDKRALREELRRSKKQRPKNGRDY